MIFVLPAPPRLGTAAATTFVRAAISRTPGPAAAATTVIAPVAGTPVTIPAISSPVVVTIVATVIPVATRPAIPAEPPSISAISPPIVPTAIPLPHPPCHELHGDLALVQLPPVGRVLGPLRLVDGAELNECVIPLHVDADQFSKGFEEHLEVFAFGGFFVEVDDEEGFGGRYFLAAFVFLALDASVAAGEFGSEGLGDVVEVHSANVRHILLHAILLGQGVRVLEKDEAIPALHVHAIHREGGRPISHAVRVVRVPAHAAAHAGGHGVEEEPLDVGGEAPVAQIAHEDGADGHAAAGAAVEGAVVGHAVAVAVAVAAQGVLGVAAHAGVGGLAVVAHGEVVVDGAAAVGVLVHVVGVVAVLGVVHGRVAVMSLFLGSGCWS
mmetsp:Transcript_1952/g.4228  ORF Transcript_1952/g.4228 Transcript_1952/m.4228 type:complete len:382 (-) Transcript_1952:54-1199(-)